MVNIDYSGHLAYITYVERIKEIISITLVRKMCSLANMPKRKTSELEFLCFTNCMGRMQ